MAPTPWDGRALPQGGLRNCAFLVRSTPVLAALKLDSLAYLVSIYVSTYLANMILTRRKLHIYGCHKRANATYISVAYI